MINPIKVPYPELDEPKKGGLIDLVKKGKIIDYLIEEHEIEKAKKFDNQEQLDRIEKKLDMALEGLDFLSKNLM